ncbi:MULTISPECIES: TspO/MBR family protein [unclassified Thalassospira]|uniref:TspO/MBR family protein n=1 Tax=unclassified Thalassospira TaxID=2648997 RepID=UPI001FEF6EEB|nr:TspO/MBR family protein [Thalassospira sp. MCCC 1A01428]
MSPTPQDSGPAPVAMSPEFNPNHRTRFFALIAFLVLCLIISVAGGAATATSVGDWYQTLNKPFFNPPNWLFGPVWSIIYALIAVAGWRVWCKTGFLPQTGGRTVFILYGAQLVLNLLWSFLFFGAQSPLAGLIDIVPLLVLILANIAVFWPIDRMAGWLMVPYALWVGFATLLNSAIWWLNS